MSHYPLDIEVEAQERIARWRPLVNWVLVVPLLCWNYVLTFGSGMVMFFGWFAIVFGGRLPQRWSQYLVGVLRYQLRIWSFLLGLTEDYPGFRVAAGHVDPGDFPAVLYSYQPADRRRLTVLFRLVLIIPQAIVVYFLTWALYPVLVIGWWPS
jgi:hypothetical protein